MSGGIFRLSPEKGTRRWGCHSDAQERNVTPVAKGAGLSPDSG